MIIHYSSLDSADIILGDNNCGFISENWEWHHADCADEKLYICELNGAGFHSVRERRVSVWN